MSYVDGFLLVIRKKNLKAYKALAAVACKVWREHGALDYKECTGEDLKASPGCGNSYTDLLKCRKDETVIFAFIVYKSRAARDKINARVMNDPRMAAMAGKKMPFDLKRMWVGGFASLVECK
ncbi:DUF1428 domain-containing protein [bacterium]|nr:MAG: DUF1428 domain-containing protein [bacterium]RIK63685.1 MAG: DUF1428 domain-containing protein [Planctomycetota bacterium]